MTPILVILNPCAGTKRANRILTDLLDIFCKSGLLPTVRVTQRRGDGRAIAAADAATFDRIVCIGGDGTFNEVVSGVLESGGRTPIGYIPAGSTNDFAASLGLSRDLRKAARDIAEGTPIPIDVGRLKDRYFTYIASFGAFTKTSYATEQTAKNTLGHFAYLLGALTAVPTIRSLHVQLTADGEELEGDYLFGGLCNALSMGGVVRLDPQHVDLRDGKFELLLIRKPKDAAQLTDCVRAMLSGKLDSELVELRKVRTLTVCSDTAPDWSLDGEFFRGSRSVHMEVLPAAAMIYTKSDKGKNP